jgi:hypothetical protein
MPPGPRMYLFTASSRPHKETPQHTPGAPLPIVTGLMVSHAPRFTTACPPFFRCQLLRGELAGSSNLFELTRVVFKGFNYEPFGLPTSRRGAQGLASRSRSRSFLTRAVFNDRRASGVHVWQNFGMGPGARSSVTSSPHQSQVKVTGRGVRGIFSPLSTVTEL